MEQTRLTLKPAEKIFNKNLKDIITTDAARYLVNSLVILAFIYNADKFPEVVKDLSKKPAFQLILSFFSIYIATNDFALAVVSVVLLAIGVIFINKMNSVEHFKVLEVVPGCETTNVKDLLALFGGDAEKLGRAMYTIGVPLNTELTDETAPVIASYFVNYSKKVTDTCHPPTGK